MARIIGVLTIGQSPRPDGLGRDVQAVVGPNVRVIERGALDGLTRDEIAAMAPREGDYRLITLLSDGISVQLSKKRVLELVQRQIAALEDEEDVAATLLMCTGEFPPFAHRKPLLQPQAALYGAVIGIAGGGTVGSLTPLPTQLDQARRKWRDMGVEHVTLADANPYGPDPVEAVRAAAAQVRKEGANVLFMDCFGYDLPMRDAARDSFGGPVVLARSLAARLITEIVS